MLGPVHPLLVDGFPASSDTAALTFSARCLAVSAMALPGFLTDRPAQRLLRVEAHDRKQLEQLCGYTTRPALSGERVRSGPAFRATGRNSSRCCRHGGSATRCHRYAVNTVCVAGKLSFSDDGNWPAAPVRGCPSKPPFVARPLACQSQLPLPPLTSHCRPETDTRQASSCV